MQMMRAMMGQRVSWYHDRSLLAAVRDGDTELVEAIMNVGGGAVFGRGKLSPIHVAALSGRIELLSMLLDRLGNPDVLTRHKQTPLMLAAMHGHISCVQTLIQAGANVLMFDSLHGRTCLHYASYYGHSHCLQAILSAALSSPVAHSWGFARFVNIRDRRGNTPLHLAARKRRPECLRLLLEQGALVCASTTGNTYRGSTPLHLAARGGSLDCVRHLLAHGANRLKLDNSGRIPYTVAMRHNNRACAALLSPSAAEPLVWPSPLKFISELGPEAKGLLEKALMEANLKREKAILKKAEACDEDDDSKECGDGEVCCICFEQKCVMEVKPCGHEMCAHCVIALCCHNKPISGSKAPPLCPFCRSSIGQLVVATIKPHEEEEARKSRLSAMGSFGRMCSPRSSAKVVATSDHVDLRVH